MFKKILITFFLLSFSTFAKINVTYSVPDMICGSCAKVITEQLIKRRNLKESDIQFNIEKKQVEITFENDKPLTKEDLHFILVYAGYDLIKK